MKRLWLALLLVLLAPTLLFSADATVTQSMMTAINPTSSIDAKQAVYSVSMICTAATADVTFPATVVTGTAVSGTNAMKLWGWYLYSVTTLSGATQVTNGCSYTVKDASGFDLMGGKGATVVSNSTTVPVKTFAYPASGGFSPVTGPLTLAVTGNLVNNASVTVELVFVR